VGLDTAVYRTTEKTKAAVIYHRITRMKQVIALLCVLAMSTQTAAAWNYTGHRAIAFLTYSMLNEKAKRRVGELLRAHPDYQAILSKSASKQPWDIARNAFVTASTWPDIIRNDARFSDDGKAPVPPGFPDSNRHTDWHFINTPWPSEFSSQPIPPINAVTQIKAMMGQLKSSGPATSTMAYAVPWLLHMVSDLHQPLHAIARFEIKNGKPDHDRGGNACYVEPGRNLHSFWDGLLGRDDTEAAVARLAASLMDETPVPAKLDVKPETWVKETIEIASTHVYSVKDCSNREAPVRLSPEYLSKGERLAHARAAVAAYRLAKMLNDRLGK
jgi:hypothetical protein